MSQYADSLKEMPPDALVRHGIHVYLGARRSRTADDYAYVDLIGAECFAREGRHGQLWQQILSGVLAEEAAIRRSNEAATESLRAMHAEATP